VANILDTKYCYASYVVLALTTLGYTLYIVL